MTHRVNRFNRPAAAGGNANFLLGVDARILGGTDIELFGASGDADYGQVGLVLGWGWD